MWPHHSWLKNFPCFPNKKGSNKKAQSLGRAYAMSLSSKAPQTLSVFLPTHAQGGLFTLSPTGTACSYLRAFAHDCFSTWANCCLLTEPHISSFTSFRFCTNVAYQSVSLIIPSQVTPLILTTQLISLTLLCFSHSVSKHQETLYPHVFILCLLVLGLKPHGTRAFPVCSLHCPLHQCLVHTLLGLSGYWQWIEWMNSILMFAIP